jgi:glycosyltransferase involved in cell wall biosynthesis
MSLPPPSPDLPLISVVIPTWNRVGYLREAIASVLGQDYPHRELIVVDDGSTDATPQLLAEYGDQLTVVRQPNRGIAAARNAGVARAHGSFLAFLDDDDLWLSDKLSRQMQRFRAQPSIAVVHGHTEQFASPELSAEVRARFRHHDGQVLPAPLPASMLARRTAFDQVGAFDEALSIGVEVDWYARLQDSGLGTVMLDAVLYRRRLHPGNINLTRAHEQRERVQVLRQVLQRRRASAAPPCAPAPASPIPLPSSSADT